MNKRRVPLMRIWMLTFALLIFAAYPVQAETETAAEENAPFAIRCEADESIYISENAESYPIIVTVTNQSGQDFEGTVMLMLYQGTNTDEVIAYGQSAVIADGESAAFQFGIQNIYFSTAAYQIPVRVDLLDGNGNTLFKQVTEFDVESDGYGILTAGIISQNDRLATMLASSGFAFESDYYAGKISIDGVDMEEETLLSMDLSCFDMLLMDENVSDDAWEKVTDWLLKGGYLMIGQSVYEDRFDKTLNDSHQTTWGTGTILVYEDTDWTSSSLMQSVKDLFGTQGIEALVEGSYDDYYSAEDLLSYDPWSESPAFGSYLVLLIIYLLLIGPVVYLIMRKRDRSEYLWAAIPCLAIIFSLLIYQAGSNTRYSDAFVRYATTLWLTKEGNVETTSVLVTSPDDDHLVLTVDGESSLTPLYGDYWWELTDTEMAKVKAELLDEDFDVALTASDEGTGVIINARSLFDEKYLGLSSINDNSGMIETDLTWYCGELTGTIANRTEWDLTNVFVTYDGIFVLVGDLDAGAFAELSQSIDYRLLVCDSRIDFATAAFDGDINEAAVNNMMNTLMDYQNFERGKNVVGGFTDHYDIALLDNDQLEAVNGLALIMNQIDVTDSEEGWQSVTAIGPVPLTEEDEWFDTYSYDIWTENAIEMYYQIDVILKAEYVGWLNADQENLSVEFYNYTSGAYERVFEGSPFISGEELSDYIDDDNRIQARVQVLNWNDTRYVPVLTVTGGEADD